MGWFGLFDLLRFCTDPSTPDGWALPGSQWRLTDRHLAALYHGVITDVGGGFHADLFDIAAHHLARSSAVEPGAFHIDMRMTGRPARMLFGADQTQSMLTWHAPSATAQLRLAGSEHPAVLPQVDLLALLHRTLPICRIATLSAWVEDFTGIEQAMKLLDPWLTTGSRAVVRLPQTALAAMLARLPAWPARCVAVLPCSDAADDSGGGETLGDVLVCFEDISAQTPEIVTERMLAAARVVRADTWNDKPRARRGSQQGGVSVRLPAPNQVPPAPGLPITLLGDAPANLAGAAFAAMQTRPFQPESGFDYLLDISAATIIAEHGTLFVVPQHGPVVVDPAMLPDADAAGIAPDAMARFLLARNVAGDGGFTARHRAAVTTIATRPTLLLSASHAELDHVTQIWPNLQHLFELCDRERLALGDVDVLMAGEANASVIDSLLHSGLSADQLRFSFDGVLFRRLLVANPASRADTAQRAAQYDRFWTRRAETQGHARLVSFSKPKPSGKIMLVDPLAAPIVNGADLQAMARDRGYQIVSPAGVGMASMASSLAAARVVIGPSALLGWSCLASAATLGLLHPSNETALPFPALHAASARGHAIVAMFGTSIGAAANAPFVIAPDRFTALLDRVEAGASTRRGRAEPAL